MTEKIKESVNKIMKNNIEKLMELAAKIKIDIKNRMEYKLKKKK